MTNTFGKFRNTLTATAVVLTTAIMLAPAVQAQGYGNNGYNGNRNADKGYNNGRPGNYNNGGQWSRGSSARDQDLLRVAQQLESDVQARRNQVPPAFYESAMRNVRTMENGIRESRNTGGLSNSQYYSIRDVLNKIQFNLTATVQAGNNNGYGDRNDRPYHR